jgi:hypothetical protein
MIHLKRFGTRRAVIFLLGIVLGYFIRQSLLKYKRQIEAATRFETCMDLRRGTSHIACELYSLNPVKFKLSDEQ